MGDKLFAPQCERNIEDGVQRPTVLDRTGREIRGVPGGDQAASWENDIGQVSEMLEHTFGSPAVVFDDIPGYPAGTSAPRERERHPITAWR